MTQNTQQPAVGGGPGGASDGTTGQPEYITNGAETQAPALARMFSVCERNAGDPRFQAVHVALTALAERWGGECGQ